MTTTMPRSEIDLWSDEALTDPHPLHRALRDLGPAVWLPRFEVYAIARFADVKATLANAETFVSGQGVAMTPPVNQVMRGGIIAADGVEHAAMRAIVGAPFGPKRCAPCALPLLKKPNALPTRSWPKKSSMA